MSLQILVWVPNAAHFGNAGYVPHDRWSQLLVDALRVAFPDCQIGLTNSPPLTWRMSKNGALIKVNGMPKSGLVSDGFLIADQAQKVVDEYVPDKSEWVAYKVPKYDVPFHAPERIQ